MNKIVCAWALLAGGLLSVGAQEVKRALPAKPPPSSVARGPARKSAPRPAPQPLPVRTYRDVLAVIPREMEPDNARQWSAAEKEVANLILRKKLVDARRQAVMSLRVNSVADWDRIVLVCDIANDEGYFIRVFAGATQPPFLAQLAAVKPGDRIVLEGALEKVVFENLWGTDSLSICLREDSKLTKLQPNGPPMPPADRRPPPRVISATYGSGTAFADVTDRVNVLLAQPGAVFAAKPHWLGADPTPGWNKALVIVHQAGPARRVFAVGEGGEVGAELLAEP